MPIDLDELQKRTTRQSVLGGHGLDVVNMHGSEFDALIAELRTLRARVAEMERTTPSLEWIDLRPAHEPMREMLALSYEQGRCDALRGVQGACLYEEAANEPALRSSDAAIRARRRVREVMEANGTNPERFVSEWCRAQAEYETEEAAR